MQNDLKTFGERDQQLQRELEKGTSGLETEARVHRDEEQMLSKRNLKLQQEVSEWIKRYDEEMLEKHDELESVTAVYRQECEDLAQLRARFEIIDAERQEIAKDRELQRDLDEYEAKQIQRLDDSAELIQMLWRRYHVAKRVAARVRRATKRRAPKS